MNVVSVMAHQDDELMCLGTMLRMQEQGHNLHFICVTDGSTGMITHPDMSREDAAEIRDREMSELADMCSATYTCFQEHDEFLYDTPELRVRLINTLRTCQADAIFTHYNPDYNLDHMAVNLLVRQCSMQMPFPMIHTDAPPTNGHPAVFLVEPAGGFEFEASHYVDISSVIERKCELALCHKSQDDAFRAGLGHGLDTWMMGISGRRGDQAGVEHAEAFRPMLSRGLVKAYSILP